MGQVLHGSATTTAAIRRAIQHSQESLRGLAKRYGINPKTVAKWRSRSSVQDRPTGPKRAQSTVLSVEDEAVVVAFRRHTLLPLDDCLYALQATIPHLTRSSLHRCLQRHGISRLPDVESAAPGKRKFKTYPLGYFHIDIAEVQTTQGRLYLLVAIDRVTKFAFVELHEKATRSIAGDFLRALIKAVPYTVHTVLTDNGTHFTSPGNTCSAASEIRRAMDQGELFRAHAFEHACAQNHIDHRLTKPRHPWTNGQVERMNRTLKEATVKRFHYNTHDQLRRHLDNFVSAYNFGRRLNTLKGLTPYEAICKAWTAEPKRFTLNPLHQMPGLNTDRDSEIDGQRRVMLHVHLDRAARAGEDHGGQCGEHLLRVGGSGLLDGAPVQPATSLAAASQRTRAVRTPHSMLPLRGPHLIGSVGGRQRPCQRASRLGPAGTRALARGLLRLRRHRNGAGRCLDITKSRRHPRPWSSATSTRPRRRCWRWTRETP